MTDFSVGDRVRVIATAESYASRKGEVVWDSRTRGGCVYAYHVRVDGTLSNSLGVVRAIFGPADLEPETEGNSP